MQPVPEYAAITRMMDDTRSLAQIEEHYALEVRLADRLRNSGSTAERTRLYTELYDELFRALPHHPQNARKGTGQDTYIARQLGILRPHLKPDDVFVEIGGGDCRLSWAVAPYVKAVVAVEITDRLYDAARAPSNVRLVVTDGVDLPLAPGSADVVFSNQLMEHLHPEDARTQLRSIYQALRPQGRYVCLTPSATSGPHDISRYFDRTASGFHMKEYDYASIAAAMRAAGFDRIEALLVVRGRVLGKVDVGLARRLETWVTRLPEAGRRAFGRSGPGKCLLGLKVIATRT